MRFFYVLIIFIVASSLCYSDELQSLYIESMKAYDRGDYTRAFRMIDGIIMKTSDIPDYFYVKSVFYLSEMYANRKTTVTFVSNTLQRYLEILDSRNVYSEKVFEEILKVSSELGIGNISEESLFRLLSVSPSNQIGIYTLVKYLFSLRKYEYIPSITTRFGNDEFSEIYYLSLMSKVYLQDYRDFDPILQSVIYNYNSVEVRYIVGSIYYQMMEFDKAWVIFNSDNNRGEIIDPEMYLKLMIIRSEGQDKILSFLDKYKDDIDKEFVLLAKMVFTNKNLLEDYLKKFFTSYKDEPVDPVFIHVGLNLPKNSFVHIKSTEKMAIDFYSKKLYHKVIEVLDKRHDLDTSLRYILALSYFELREYVKALKLLKSIENRVLEAKVKIPALYIEIGDYKKALSKAKSIVGDIIKDGSDVDKIILSQVFIELRDFDNAKKVIDSIRDRSSFYYRLLLATIHFFRGNYSKSEKILNNLLDEDRYNPDVMNSLAFVLAVQGKDFKKALLLSKFSLVLDENYHYLDTLAYIYSKLGELNLAKENIEKAILLMEKEKKFSKDVYLNAYNIYKSLGDIEKSKIMLSKANRGL
ncbi:MAG: hypothetical protein N2712_01285 [Brevinematales bacterium]|nr:hypothetical protein [Brevinematales bacterium]